MRDFPEPGGPMLSIFSAFRFVKLNSRVKKILVSGSTRRVLVLKEVYSPLFCGNEDTCLKNKKYSQNVRNKVRVYTKRGIE